MATHGSKIFSEWRSVFSRLGQEVFQSKKQPNPNFTIQDSVVLNLLHACEASIDLAMHRISLGKLGIPQSSRDAFDILPANSVIQATTNTAMKNMVGFRNIAVHSDERLQRPILEAIVARHLGDFEDFIFDLSTRPSH